MSEFTPRNVLLSEGSPRRMLRVTEIQSDSATYLDARIFFQDPKTQEWIPTKKGLTLNRTNYLALAKLIQEKDDEIRSWLGLTYVPGKVQAEGRSTAEAVAQPGRLSDVSFFVKAGSAGGAPYDVAFAGSKASVTFNAKHPWIVQLIDERGQDALAPVAQLVAAQGHALHRSVANEGEEEFPVMAQCLEMETSKTLYLLSNPGKKR